MDKFDLLWIPILLIPLLGFVLGLSLPSENTGMSIANGIGVGVPMILASLLISHYKSTKQSKK
jgi:hypothetical protein